MKLAGLGELAPARPLRQIAGNRHELGSDASDRREQRLDEPRIETAEMQVREVDNRAHGSAPGTITRSDAGRTRDRAAASHHGHLAVERRRASRRRPRRLDFRDR